MKKYIVLIAFALLCSSAFASGSTIYPWPINWSPKDLAVWAQPLMYSNATLPAVGDGIAGDIVVLAEGDGQFSFYRLDTAGTAWESLKFDTDTIDASMTLALMSVASHTTSLATISASIAVTKALENGAATTDFQAQNFKIHGQVSQYDSTAETREPNWRRAHLTITITDEVIDWKNVGYFAATAQSVFEVTAKIKVSDNLPSTGGLIRRWGVRDGTVDVLASEAYRLTGNAGTMSTLVQLVASGTGYSLQCKEISGKASVYDISVCAEGEGVGAITQQ